MRSNDTADRVLEAVRAASLLGVTSPEISNAHDMKINNVTAALHALTEEKCVRREKDASAGHLYRYWFVRERGPHAPRVLAVRAPSGPFLTIPLGDTSVTVSLAQGRKLYAELHKIFGGQ